MMTSALRGSRPSRALALVLGVLAIAGCTTPSVARRAAAAPTSTSVGSLLPGTRPPRSSDPHGSTGHKANVSATTSTSAAPTTTSVSTAPTTTTVVPAPPPTSTTERAPATNSPPPAGTGFDLPGTTCPAFPKDNVWNTPVTGLPVDPKSATWLASMDASTTYLHPDYGPSGNPKQPYGIPGHIVSPSPPLVHVSFTYPSESDPGPYPLSSSTPLETASARHSLMATR